MEKRARLPTHKIQMAHEEAGKNINKIKQIKKSKMVVSSFNSASALSATAIIKKIPTSDPYSESGKKCEIIIGATEV